MEHKLQEVITETNILIGRLISNDNLSDRNQVNKNIDFISGNINIVISNDQLKKSYSDMIENYDFLMYKISGVENITDIILDKINNGVHTEYDIKWLESISRL